jgi:hypothetical protein
MAEANVLPMERRSLLVYFDMRLEEDRELLQRLRPYITSRRGNDFIKTAIREKFERLALSQVRTGGFGSRPPPSGEQEPHDETELSPVPSADLSAVVAPQSPRGLGEVVPTSPAQVFMGSLANTMASADELTAAIKSGLTNEVVEMIEAGQGSEPRDVSTPGAEVHDISSRDIKPPRPRLGRLM